MYGLSRVVSVLEGIAPTQLADPEDVGRIGVVVDRRNNVSSAAVSLDPPDFAFEEAARLEVDLAHLPSSDAVPSSEHAHVRDVREEGR